MKFLVCPLLLLAGCCLLAANVRAGDNGKSSPDVEAGSGGAGQNPSACPWSLTWQIPTSGSADVRRDGRDSSLDEQNSLVRVVFTPRVIPRGDLRLGVEWERLFVRLFQRRAAAQHAASGQPRPRSGLLAHQLHPAPLRGAARAVRHVLRPHHERGIQRAVHLRRFVPLQRQPPVLLRRGGGREPQVSGASRRRLPLEGRAEAGSRRATPPPRASNTILPGAPRSLPGRSSRRITSGCDEHFGDSHLDNRHDERVLNHALVTFSEVRAGVGLSQRLSGSLTVSIDGGCQPYREFDFHRADVRYRSDGLAPYGQIALHGAF